MQWDETQQETIDRILDRDTNEIITGHAGTGKTTVIKELADQIKHVELLCPTGKGAAQVQERTGYPAATIHRALGYDGREFHRGGTFDRTVIIDEASMIDSHLLGKILEYRPPRLILVGDPSQLPPVGPGAPFHDLIERMNGKVNVLEHCHRAGGAIHRACMDIRHGKVPDMIMQSDGEVFQFIKAIDTVSIIRKLRKWIEQGKYEPEKDLIMAPSYGAGQVEYGGIDAINEAVKKMVNPSDDKWEVGDRVLNTKNFAALDYWNGDIGTIKAIDVNGYLYVHLDRVQGDEVFCQKEQKDAMRHGYCVSIHKAQGSQARNVFFVCMKHDKYMLHRSLIYTAVTRARKACVVMGHHRIFVNGIMAEKRKETVLRYL